VEAREYKEGWRRTGIAGASVQRVDIALQSAFVSVYLLLLLLLWERCGLYCFSCSTFSQLSCFFSFLLCGIDASRCRCWLV
jgi:hypothetical protein